jgi:hypothetical protein
MTDMTVKERHFICAIMLLDACDDVLDAAAERERKREAGKVLRSTTNQQRAKTVREFVREMEVEYGLLLPR